MGALIARSSTYTPQILANGSARAVITIPKLFVGVGSRQARVDTAMREVFFWNGERTGTELRVTQVQVLLVRKRTSLHSYPSGAR